MRRSTLSPCRSAQRRQRVRTLFPAGPRIATLNHPNHSPLHRALATEKQLASARDRLRRRDLQLQCESFDAWRLRRVALLAFSTLAFLGLRSVLTHEAVVRTSIAPRQPTRSMDTLF